MIKPSVPLRGVMFQKVYLLSPLAGFCHQTGNELLERVVEEQMVGF